MAALRPGVIAVLRRECRQLAYGRSERMLVLWLPLALGLLIWWIFAAGTPRELPLAVVDQDRSGASRALLQQVAAAPGVQLLAVTDLGAGQQALARREAYGLLVVPAGFGRELAAGRQAGLVLQHNAQFATHSAQLLRDVRGAVAAHGAELTAAAHERRGLSHAQAQALARPVAVHSLPLYNEALNYQQFLGASLVPAVLQILVMVTAAAAIGRELRDGSAGRWLALAGGRVIPALAGKLIPYALIFLGWGALFVVGYAMLGKLPVRGSLAVVLAGVGGLVLASLALGVLALALTRNLRMALSVAGFYTAPAFAYAGQAFPLHAMPAAAQGWAGLLPLTHWLTLQNQAWIAGAPAAVSQGPLLALLTLTLLPLLAGGLLLRRRGFSAAAWGAR